MDKVTRLLSNAEVYLDTAFKFVRFDDMLKVESSARQAMEELRELVTYIVQSREEK